MIPDGYSTREVFFDDFDRITELINRIEQEKLTVDDLRARWLNKNRKQWRQVVLHGETIVGYAGCLQAITGGGGIYLIRVDVDEAHQGKGIGRALLELADQAGRNLGAELLTTKSRDDMPREKCFCEAAGYEPFEHLQGVTLDFQTYSAPETQTGGESLLTWAEIGDSPENRRKLYEMYSRTEFDSPGIEVWGIPSFEGWETGIFTASWYRSEGLLVASVDGEWVGLAIVGPMEDGIWTTDYTGVIPEHRGKGIATRLKIAALDFARRNGAVAIHTFNDALNGPMRAINDKLGFKADTGWWMYRKTP